jgi:heme A synthase
LRSALVVTAALSLGVVLLGGFETNVRLWAKLDPAHLHLAQSTFMTRGPRSVAELLLAVLLLPGWFAWRAQRGYAHKGVVVWLVAAALLAGTLAGASGFAGITGTSIAAWHAIVGHVVFACIAAATVFALTGSPDAPDSPAPKLQIIGGFPLRPFAPWLPPLVVTQVAMGAAYRHGQWGVLPHLIGAMVVAFLLVAESVLLLQRAPEHRLLRRAAHWALGAVLLQVALGVLDYLVRLLDFQDTTAWFALSLAHVTVGSITLAGTIYLAVSVRICILNPVITPQPTLNS